MMKALVQHLPLNLENGLCAGDWVRVKPWKEILATLDKNGRLDGMPFMPEMLQYCGRSFRVYKRAHKTCDFSTAMEARRLKSSVHLEGLRCDGLAHDGCQAECLMFWREAWLDPVQPPSLQNPTRSRIGRDAATPGEPGAAVADLFAATVTSETAGEKVYVCQNTEIPRFTTPLRAKEFDQYVEAFVSGNVRLRNILPPLIFRVYERIHYSRLGRTGIPRRLYDAFQKVRGGVRYPNRLGLIPLGQKTPVGEKLNLQPGEFVRVKSHQEILATLNTDSKNRGLLFSQELVPYCGQIARVHSRVSRIIDEKTGRMLQFGNDCIILENVICQGRYNAGMTYCPRANYPYWREIWLERVAESEVPQPLREARIQTGPCQQCVSATVTVGTPGSSLNQQPGTTPLSSL